MHTRLRIATSDAGGARRAARRQDVAVLSDIEDRGTADADGTAARRRRGTREGDTVEVGEGHKPAAGREVLDNPLGVGLAEAGALAAEGVRDGLPRGLVLDDRRAACLAASRHGHLDRVARTNLRGH